MMDCNALMAISPLDGRYHQKLTDIRPLFSEYGLMKYRVHVEISWLIFLADQSCFAELPPLNPLAKKVLFTIFDDFSLDDAQHIKTIEARTKHDIKAVEYFLKEKIKPHTALATQMEFIHFACTSEDINNLAYGLMLKKARSDIILPSLTKLLSDLKKMAHQFAPVAMLARTHGQPATPTTVGKEIANTVARIQRQLNYFTTMPILGKMNGATGNFNSHVVTDPTQDWQALTENFVTHLGLEWNPYTTQIEPHDGLADYCHVMIRINTILLDFSRDMWGYIALNYFQLKTVSEEIGSSTMPHKVNPIDFENAEGNLGIANALFQHLAGKLPISRWQRDLSDSTALRNIGVAISHAVLAYQALWQGLQKITPQTSIIAADLAQHWEILAEPIQMVMRRYGLDQPYEQLKKLTRGQTVTPQLLHEFIETLALPPAVKNRLLALTPQNYVGLAETLAKNI